MQLLLELRQNLFSKEGPNFSKDTFVALGYPIVICQTCCGLSWLAKGPSTNSYNDPFLKFCWHTRGHIRRSFNQPTSRVRSKRQTPLGQSLIQVLTELTLLFILIQFVEAVFASK